MVPEAGVDGNQFLLGDAPDAHILVGDCDVLTMRRPGQGTPVVLTLEGKLHVARGGLPDLDQAGAGCRCEQISLGRPAQIADTGHGGDTLPSSGAPDDYPVGLAADCQIFTIGRPSLLANKVARGRARLDL